MTVAVTDTFTDTSATELSLHTGETGATWTKIVGTTDIAISNANRARGTGSSAARYRASGVADVADVDATAIIRKVDARGLAAFAARYQTGADTAYVVSYQESGTVWTLYRMVAAAFTSLSTFVQAWTAGTDKTAVLKIRGSGATVTIDVVVDGVTIITFSDTDANRITTAGTTGVHINAATTASLDARSYHIDSLELNSTTQTISPNGIASAEAFGSATVTPGAVTIAPNAIASAEAFGSPTVTQAGAAEQTIVANGIASAEAFGSPAVTVGAVTIAPNGIGSAEAFGSAVVSTGPVTIVPTAIGSAEAFGAPSVTPGAVTVVPIGIATAEAFGAPSVTVGPVTIAALAIGSAEAFGLPDVQPGAVTVAAVGIASAEAFGAPTISFGLPVPYVSPGARVRDLGAGTGVATLVGAGVSQLGGGNTEARTV